MESIYGNKINASLLDTDFYTFTMMQAVLHRHPDVEVEYELIERNGEDLVPYIGEIRQQLEKLADLSMTPSELAYLEAKSYMKPDFIRFLSLFRFNLRYIHVAAENGQLSIKIRGPWLHCIMFEQPVLAMISEIRNRNVYPDATLSQVTERLYEKFDRLVTMASAEDLSLLKVADFATRRRASLNAQNEMIEVMKKDFPGKFVGTSNVHFAKEHNISALGTMAHQWLMAYQQLGPRVRDSQAAALEGWVQEYRGELGIALTDCVTSDAFIKDFDLYYAKLFDGCRHDSGNPIVWAEKFIAHYKRLGIDPMTKTLIFSDGLNFDVCLQIIKALKGRINFSFGIGTNLGNDVPGLKPLSIVIKMTRCNDAPVAKISDEPKKVMCKDELYLSYLKNVFNVTE